MESVIAPIKWAQRKNIVFLTIEARDVSEENRQIEVTPEGHLHFEGVSKDLQTHYKIDLDLFDEVVPEECKWKVTGYSVSLSISKKNKEGEFWPRLIKEKVKINWIQVDWNKWVDEDQEEEKPEMEFDDYEDFPDSDDEEDEDEADLGDIDGPPDEESKE